MTEPHDHDTGAPEGGVADSEGTTTETDALHDHATESEGTAMGAMEAGAEPEEARREEERAPTTVDDLKRRFQSDPSAIDDERLDADGNPSGLTRLIAMERSAVTEPAPPDGDADTDGADASEGAPEGAPEQDDEDDTNTTDTHAHDTTTAPEFSMDLSNDPIRLRIREMINGTAQPGPLATDVNDAQIVALRHFLDALPDEATYTAWQKGLSEAERARTLAILNDPRALTVFGFGWKAGDPLTPETKANADAVATEDASNETASSSPASSAAETAATAAAPSTPGDAVNQQIAKRFARVGSKAGTPRTTAGAPAARPGRPGAPSAVVATPQPLAPPAAKPGKCVRGCRLNHTHRF